MWLSSITHPLILGGYRRRFHDCRACRLHGPIRRQDESDIRCNAHHCRRNRSRIYRARCARLPNFARDKGRTDGIVHDPHVHSRKFCIALFMNSF